MIIEEEKIGREKNSNCEEKMKRKIVRDNWYFVEEDAHELRAREN
jgi:hypothetical protein